MTTHLDNIKQAFDHDTQPRNLKAYNLSKSILHHLLSAHFRDGKMLDLGGGEGTLTETLNNVIVADYCMDPLRRAARKNYEAACCDMHCLPFKNDSFSLIMMSHVLQHSFQPNKVISEVIRTLKIGGILILIVPNAAGLFQLLKLIRTGQVRPMGNPPQRDVMQGHQYTFENTRQWLLERGFKILHITGDFLSIPVLWKWSKWYLFSHKISRIFPKLSDSLIFVVQRQKP